STDFGRRLSCTRVACPSGRSTRSPPKSAARLIASTWKLARYRRWTGSASTTGSVGFSAFRNRCRRDRHPSAVSMASPSVAEQVGHVPGPAAVLGLVDHVDRQGGGQDEHLGHRLLFQ